MSLGQLIDAPDGDGVRPKPNSTDIVTIWFEALEYPSQEIFMIKLFLVESK